MERRILRLISTTDQSPYGNPIPGLDEFGLPANRPFLEGVADIQTLTHQRPGPVRSVVRRLGEPVQFEPDLLRQFHEVGIVPGAPVTVEAVDDYTRIKVDGHDEGLELAPDIASHVFVETAAGRGD